MNTSGKPFSFNRNVIFREKRTLGKLGDMIEEIERLQRELAAMRDFHQGYLDRRARTGITTNTDSVMADHQRTLNETLDLLEALKAVLREQQSDQH